MRLRRALCVGVGLCLACFGQTHAASASPGSRLFTQEGCSSCHTLVAAGASGKVGPDLTYLNPTTATVIGKVLHGGGGMPSFRHKLSSSQVATLAYWVSWAANLGILSAARVSTIQKHLAKLGYFHRPPTGVYAATTTAAVERFQKLAGLPPTGIWGPETAAAVARRLG